MSTRPALVSMSVLTLLVALGAAVAIALKAPSSDPTISLTVESDPAPAAIPDRFIGISLETWAVDGYAGTDPRAINPVLVALLRGLQHHMGSIRIGGSSADATWWPIRGMRRPPGDVVTIDGKWVGVVRSLADATRARLILDVNLEDPDIRVGVAEARALLAGIGPSRIQALELGNEPELWGSWSWYRARNGRSVMARPRGYKLPDYIKDATRFARLVRGVPLAGPTNWAPKWIPRLREFLKAEPRVRVVTLHRYPLAHCFTNRSAPWFGTIPHLLTAGEAHNLTWSLARSAAIAHARHLPLQLDELNSISCSGLHGVSDTFASALWALDALFAVAQTGVDGVNIHTFPAGAYSLFDFAQVRRVPGMRATKARGRPTKGVPDAHVKRVLGAHVKGVPGRSGKRLQGTQVKAARSPRQGKRAKRSTGERPQRARQHPTAKRSSWLGYVHPEYYGLLMFSRAAPAGSRLLRLSWNSYGPLRAWATRARDGRVRVVLINQDVSSHKVSLSLPDVHGAASVQRLLAPSLAATGGVTIAGQTFGPRTSTGQLGGRRTSEETKQERNGHYVVVLQGPSAVLLTFRPSR